MDHDIVLRNPDAPDESTDKIAHHPKQPDPYMNVAGKWEWLSDQNWRVVNYEHLRVYDLTERS